MSWMSRFSLSMVYADDFRSKLATISQEHPTAKDQGKQECCRSGVCCWRRPGCLSKEDVDRLATHLNLTPQELFQQHLKVDKFESLVLLPRRKHQSGGDMVSWKESYSIESPCSFLAENGDCSIHPAKPIACASYKCWEGDKPVFPEWTREELECLGWDGFDPDDYDSDDD